MLNLPEKITITQENVNQFLAEREAGVGLTHCCPIHQALRPYMAQHSEVENFEVGSGWLDVYFGETYYEEPYAYQMLRLDDQARDFILAVDKFNGPSMMQFPTEITLLKGPDTK